MSECDRPRPFASWGGSRARNAIGIAPSEFPRRTEARPALPYGNGRSYGDTCLLSDGAMIEARQSRRILSFDSAEGLLRVEAGALLSEIVAFAAPKGWFPQVLPGTQYVTVGGAIANDVHGKNHHRRGTFGCHVERLVLSRSDRGRLVCSRWDHPDLFAATLGGMGLTGFIEEATLRLMPVGSSEIRETTTRFGCLDDYFKLADEADERHEYAVAWIDSLSRGDRFGRGHLICGDHAATGARVGASRSPLATIPLTPPISPLRGASLMAFNAAYYRKARAGTHTRTVAFDSFFFPLDRLGGWNRLYGPKGLCQHQCVVPFEGGRESVRALLECARAHGHGSFLTVLKRFGSAESPGAMSFPKAGYTLTLDFPFRGAATLRLLAELDRITIEAGGRVNAYKQHRMTPDVFAASYPRRGEVEALRDPELLSDFWLRMGMAFPRTLAERVDCPAGKTVVTLRHETRREAVDADRS